MSPDFDELVGDDLEPAERSRLERVHELLVAAGPPPDFVPVAEVVELRPRRRRAALVAIAAALAVALFAFGAALVNGSTSGAPETISMVGTPAAQTASASIELFELDEAGNWPMKVSVAGLEPAPSGRPFELWLKRDGKLAALCGSFLTDESGAAVVPMNAPYKFSEYDGWVVVQEGSETPLLTT